MIIKKREVIKDVFSNQAWPLFDEQILVLAGMELTSEISLIDFQVVFTDGFNPKVENPSTVCNKLIVDVLVSSHLLNEGYKPYLFVMTPGWFENSAATNHYKLWKFLEKHQPLQGISPTLEASKSILGKICYYGIASIDDDYLASTLDFTRTLQPSFVFLHREAKTVLDVTFANKIFEQAILSIPDQGKRLSLPLKVNWPMLSLIMCQNDEDILIRTGDKSEVTQSDAQLLFKHRILNRFEHASKKAIS